MDKYSLEFGDIYVIDEGKQFTYGTKERITANYVAAKMKEGFREFVYAGPVNAMGAFALAQGCVENNVRCTLFLIGTRLSKQAKGFPSNIVIYLVQNNLRELNVIAEKYVQENNKRLLVPFGINDVLYKDLLLNSIRNDCRINNLKPQRMWLAVGSGTLLSVLLEIFPQTEFHVVQVGKKLWVDIFSADDQKRIYLYSAPERFTQPSKLRPPYSSLLNYDAKVWQFVISLGQDGDYIWNVAGEPK